LRVGDPNKKLLLACSQKNLVPQSFWAGYATVYPVPTFLFSING